MYVIKCKFCFFLVKRYKKAFGGWLLAVGVTNNQYSKFRDIENFKTITQLFKIQHLKTFNNPDNNLPQLLLNH